MRGKPLPFDTKKKREDRILVLLSEKKGYDEIIATLKKEGLGCSTSDIATTKRKLGMLTPISRPRRSDNESNFWRGLKAQFEEMGIRSLTYDGASFKVGRVTNVTIKVH